MTAKDRRLRASIFGIIGGLMRIKVATQPSRSRKVHVDIQDPSWKRYIEH